MFGSVEGAHTKIIEKISIIRTALEKLQAVADKISAMIAMRKKYNHIIPKSCIRTILDALDTLETNYNLSVVSILSDYYHNSHNEEQNTRDYYRTITSENFIAMLDEFILKSRASIDALYRIINMRILARVDNRAIGYEIDDITKQIDIANGIDVKISLEKQNYEVCKCGSRMDVVPELSEMHCPDPTCAKVKTIIGAVFRDDQFYPQEGQKTKHGGYDTSRHYRFWMERLQALETKTFEDADLTNIEYVICRDGYVRQEINCEIMREILKDPCVSATHLNDHAPLLVKSFGGMSPPQLGFQENRLCSIRFNKLMKLYDVVNPEGGNKPYYPYFIYKIIEHMFHDDYSKLRLLDYIHLQSRETVIKNDKYYEKMCIMSDDMGLVYTATDPCRRF